MLSHHPQNEDGGLHTSLDARALERVLPHRYPMLLLDRVHGLSLTEARGYKNVSANEPWFSPAVNGFPNTLLIEAMAQLGGLLVVGPANYLCRMAYLSGISKARFTGRALPGDRLEMVATVIRLRQTAAVVSVTAQVEERTTCFAKLSYTIFDIAPRRSKDAGF